MGDYDRAEIEAISTYIEQRYPLRFERPVNSSVCITNRLTDLREGGVYYSLYDNPTLTLDVETLEEEIRLCAEIGLEYYQVFEGLFDWPDDPRPAVALERLMKYA